MGAPFIHYVYAVGFNAFFSKEKICLVVGYIIDLTLILCRVSSSRNVSPGEVQSVINNFAGMAYLASAATVAASSLGMQIADPRPLVAKIDPRRFQELLRRDHAAAPSIQLSQPEPRVETSSAVHYAEAAGASGVLRGAVQLFGDNIDTDAIIPGEFCHLNTLEALGQHAFHHVRPGFAERAARGQNLVVAGEGWGSGSSREHAVWALKGAGIQAVIAKSFAFIHKRNLVNEAVPFLVVRDPAFHAQVKEGTELKLDLGGGTVEIEALGLRFSAEPLSPIVRSLSQRGGLVPAVKQSGTQVFAAMAQ